MRTIKPCSQTGFAIVEVLIATVVLAIGFIELTRAFSNISSVAVRAVAMTRASNLTHATMERVMSQNFDAKGNKAGDYALVFDGTDDYIDVGDVTTGIKTISFWVEADAISTHTDYVLDLNGADYIKIVNGEVTVNNIDSPTYYINAVAGERTIATIDAWYHVAITTETGIVADDVDIGRVEGISTEFFFGKIDEVRLWNDVRTASEILTYYNKSYPNPYDDNTLKLYYKLNNGSGTIVYDYSSSISHGTITNAIWTSQSSSWSITLGREGETTWSGNNDVDDFHTISFVDNDYTGLDAGTNNFTGIGGRVYVKYISLNGGSGTSGDPYTFNDSGTPTDYKQITVKVGFPGTTDSTRLDAIKSAKVTQGYSLTFSPYGI
jgi:type II secretory pathway pseudopilin PulG